VLSLTGMSDRSIEKAIDELDEDSVLLVEDIDSYRATNFRKEITGNGIESQQPLTLSGILNAIDGVADSDGRILIMTSNHIDALDPALLRPGRVDLTMCLDYLAGDAFRDAFARFFPDFELSEMEARDGLTPAEFQNLVVRHKNDPKTVLALATKRVDSTFHRKRAGQL